MHGIGLKALAFVMGAVALAAGCARPQPSVEQVASFSAPPDLHLGKTPPGGPSESSTGAGAGGSGAGGYEAGRVGGINDHAVRPDQPAGIDYSRMSPVDSSGSGDGDRGNPVPPDVPLVTPPAPPAANPNPPSGSRPTVAAAPSSRP